MRVAYIRVSTQEQNEARQIEGLKKYDIEKTFIEKVSGKNITDRPELQSLLDFVREGDTVYIHDFSRLARSTKDLLEIVERLTDKGVHLVSNKENVDTSTPTGKLMLTMIGAIAEFERQNLLDRQAPRRHRLSAPDESRGRFLGRGRGREPPLRGSRSPFARSRNCRDARRGLDCRGSRGSAPRASCHPRHVTRRSPAPHTKPGRAFRSRPV